MTHFVLLQLLLATSATDGNTDAGGTVTSTTAAVSAEPANGTGIPSTCRRKHGPPDGTPSGLREWTDQVTRWLRAHTDPHTGLIQSFAPVANPELEGQGALYDQAVAAILLMDTGYLAEAERLLNTVERNWQGRGLPNYLTLVTGSAGFESTIHMGPTAWVGLAAYRYYARTGDRRYLDFARSIAEWAIAGRSNCENGADKPAHLAWVRTGEDRICAPSMGPKRVQNREGKLVDIVATEHVLDLFALLEMLVSDAEVPSDEKDRQRDAQAALGRYLVAIGRQDEACKEIDGLKAAPCLLAGGEGWRSEDGWTWRWNSSFNPSDIYFWWVAVANATNLDRLADPAADAEPHGKSNVWLAQAWKLFHKPAHTEWGEVAGMDYTLIDPARPACCSEAKQHHRRTQPLVSVEWTGEAILADRLLESSGQGVHGWRDIVPEMDKLGRCAAPPAMLLQSEGAQPMLSYPYASGGKQCVFPTGWLTPAKVDEYLPGSIAGTVWLAFGYLELNPFKAPPTHERKPPDWGYRRATAAEIPCPRLEARIDDLPTETVLTAAWLCLKQGRAQKRTDLTARAIDYATRLVDRRVTKVEGDLCKDEPVRIDEVPLVDTARLQNHEATRDEQPLPCSFESYALNDVGTAYFVRALGHRELGNMAAARADLRALADYRHACFWQPAETLYTTAAAASATGPVALETARALRSNGQFFRVSEAVCRDLEGLSDLCSSRWIPRPFLEGDAHLVSARNLFFIQGADRFLFLTGTPRGGFRFNVAKGVAVDAYLDLTVVRAMGDSTTDRVPWLNYWKPGAGLRLALNRGRFPAWALLRDLNIEAGVAYHVIRYFEDRAAVAPGTVDTELLAGASLWSAQEWWRSTADTDVTLWSEIGAGARFTRATIELARQNALRMQAGLQVGVGLWQILEPYLLLDGRWNPIQRTDWDNNLRLGAGLRVPVWTIRSEGADRFSSLLVRLDGAWQHTVAYWAHVAYVPSFRPTDDLSISLNLWGGLGSVRPAVNQSPSIGTR